MLSLGFADDGAYGSSRCLSKKRRGEGGDGAKAAVLSIPGGRVPASGTDGWWVAGARGVQDDWGSDYSPPQWVVRPGAKESWRGRGNWYTGTVAGLKQLWEKPDGAGFVFLSWGLLGRTEGLAQYRGLSCLAGRTRMRVQRPGAGLEIRNKDFAL